ncbi:MAG: molecular chaperone TorD family protein [Geminicoccaceae bacterium]|nr:molecular chaperone TorD family protein [Geminicoccaceae bacterium]
MSAPTLDEGGIAAGAVDEVDALRAATYRLLARFLAAPPDTAALEVARGLGDDASEFGRALAVFARVARATTPEQAALEYHDLFIGVGRGELVPYASFYRTGFLNEKPLAELRDDLAELGIARAPGNPEPEDHIAALCEVMAGLAEGRFGEGDLALQQRFFHRHLAPWAARFFGDLEAARAARLYQPLGTVGRLFVEIEEAGFALLR